MARVNITLSDEVLQKLDFICHENHRTRSLQVSKWVDLLIQGKMDDGDSPYEYPGEWFLNLTPEEANEAMANMKPEDYSEMDEQGVIRNAAGEVTQVITQRDLRAVKAGLETGEPFTIGSSIINGITYEKWQAIESALAKVPSYDGKPITLPLGKVIVLIFDDDGDGTPHIGAANSVTGVSRYSEDVDWVEVTTKGMDGSNAWFGAHAGKSQTYSLVVIDEFVRVALKCTFIASGSKLYPASTTMGPFLTFRTPEVGKILPDTEKSDEAFTIGGSCLQGSVSPLKWKAIEEALAKVPNYNGESFSLPHGKTVVLIFDQSGRAPHIGVAASIDSSSGASSSGPSWIETKVNGLDSANAWLDAHRAHVYELYSVMVIDESIRLALGCTLMSLTNTSPSPSLTFKSIDVWNSGYIYQGFTGELCMDSSGAVVFDDHELGSLNLGQDDWHSCAAQLTVDADGVVRYPHGDFCGHLTQESHALYIKLSSGGPHVIGGESSLPGADLPHFALGDTPSIEE